MQSQSREAGLPPSGLNGLDPAWSRLVTAPDGDGVERTWHVLDTGPRDAADGARTGTVLCVHGNPNWSYMWRRLCRDLDGWRVIAVDALNMGFSERTGDTRRLGDHVGDLNAVTTALNVEGPVVSVAHDWGGPISMGWAQANLDQVAGIVLMNTGVARPDGVKVPPLISIARSTLRATCQTTPTFLHGAFRMARPQLDRQVYSAYTAPYRSAATRSGIRDFVEDIPILETHESHGTLASIARGLEQMQHIPALLVWGAKDIIFSDAFLDDLVQRLPHAQVQRYADAGHQIVEDSPAITDICSWIDSTVGNEAVAEAPATAVVDRAPMWSAIESRRDDNDVAIVEMHAKQSSQIARSISFTELHQRVEATARGLAAAGIKPGDRLASLVSPGIDLTVLVYACMRAGVIVVAPDAALGLDGIRRALRSSRPKYVVGDWRGLTLVKALRLPANRLSVDTLSTARAKLLGVEASIEDLIARGQDTTMPTEPAPDAPAAIVFTSGSTGPSKGVVYTHGQLEAQRDALTLAFGLEPADRLVVGFAPFAVLAPALGMPTAIPAMDVTKPGELTATAFSAAAKAVDASIAFASPAALASISTTPPTGDSALEALRAVGTAGAPVSPQLLASIQGCFTKAKVYTPYGMTEVLPVTIASAAEIESANTGRGVCVGQPLPQVDVAVREVGAPSATMPPAVDVDILGEVWIRADHRCLGYHQLWTQQRHAFVGDWHRSGDVGHLDAQGRLWIEGRVDHLINTANGMLAPVAIELGAESVAGVRQAAAVGIGPAGTQQLAVVVSTTSNTDAVVASADLTAAVRNAVTSEVAAVLVAPKIPVDRRHNSKIDRGAVRVWAEAVLAGGSPPKLR